MPGCLGLALDLDGVIWLVSNPFRGAAAVSGCVDTRRVVFVTNNSFDRCVGAGEAGPPQHS